MKGSLFASALFVGVALLSGCDDIAKGLGYVPTKAEAAKQTKPDHRPPTHRFVLAEHHADIAFDTVTGQLCRTWDWSLQGSHPKVDPSTGTTPQRAEGEFAPTCLYLYEKSPSRFDSPAPLGLFHPETNK